MNVGGEFQRDVQLFLFLSQTFAFLGFRHAIILPKPENVANPIGYNDTNE
jgi:hypothetical protein